MTPIKTGQVWRRTLGKERVRIGRAWHGRYTGVENDYVRCHPLNGGPSFTTSQYEFRLRYHLTAGGDDTDA